MNKVMRVLSGIILLAALASAPFVSAIWAFSGGGLFPFIFLSSYLGLLFFSVVATYKFQLKWFVMIVAFLLVMIGMIVFDSQSAQKKNADLCARLKSDPNCVMDSPGGFACNNGRGPFYALPDCI